MIIMIMIMVIMVIMILNLWDEITTTLYDGNSIL